MSSSSSDIPAGQITTSSPPDLASSATSTPSGDPQRPDAASTNNNNQPDKQQNGNGSVNDVASNHTSTTAIPSPSSEPAAGSSCHIEQSPSVNNNGTAQAGKNDNSSNGTTTPPEKKHVDKGRSPRSRSQKSADSNNSKMKKSSKMKKAGRKSAAVPDFDDNSSDSSLSSVSLSSSTTTPDAGGASDDDSGSESVTVTESDGLESSDDETIRTSKKNKKGKRNSKSKEKVKMKTVKVKDDSESRKPSRTRRADAGLGSSAFRNGSNVPVVDERREGVAAGGARQTVNSNCVDYIQLINQQDGCSDLVQRLAATGLVIPYKLTQDGQLQRYPAIGSLNPAVAQTLPAISQMNSAVAQMNPAMSQVNFTADQANMANAQMSPAGVQTNNQAAGQQESIPNSNSEKRKASKVEFKRVDQIWDKENHNYMFTETVDRTKEEWDQFAFTVCRIFDVNDTYMETTVAVKSKYLKDALAYIMNGVKGVILFPQTAIVDPDLLFLYLEDIRRYAKELKRLAKTKEKRRVRRSAETKVAHLKVLIKFLDTDYERTKNTLYPLLKANMITYDLLWALFKPNTIIYTPTYGNTEEPRAFKVEYATKETNFQRERWYNIGGRYLDYDSKSFGLGTMNVEVSCFKGARKVTSLPCYPLEYHHEAKQVRETLIERGKKFVTLKGMNYQFHQGMAFFRKKQAVVKVNVNGRVMVDPGNHRRINPNYPVSAVRQEQPEKFDDSDDSSDEDERSSRAVGTGSGAGYDRRQDSNSPNIVKYKVIVDKDGRERVARIGANDDANNTAVTNGNGADGNQDDKDLMERVFTEEELLIASPVVLGFSFNEKFWLEFTISGIRDIQWSDDAFDTLVLPQNQKAIVKALVESHTFHAAQNVDDVIQGKGRGLVAVLHGPPGTGKTLTAESIAELLHRPLYMISAGELGTDSRVLEDELSRILDIVHSWGAVLLLDEADIFLEERTIHDIHRNALVSVFLRLLEYFQGIIFLTTNRVETFDGAFHSRIHVALRYGELDPKARRSVWKIFLERAQAVHKLEKAEFADKGYDLLARHNLNGRQIKNFVRTAQALASNEKKPLSMDHIKCVLDVAESFDQDLRGGSGYLDAMRSYA